MVAVRVDHLKRHLIIGVINTILAFALFFVDLAWDHQIWIAALALPVGMFCFLWSCWIAHFLRVYRQS